MDDIAASNQRQSDFYWGYEDGRDGNNPRNVNDDYMRGYRLARREWRNKTREEVID
jgi:hypothetical protein